MALPSGVCKYLNEDTNLCRIYSTRPIFCNIDAYYEKYLKNTMTREYFYERNKEACRKMQNELQSAKRGWFEGSNIRRDRVSVLLFIIKSKNFFATFLVTRK